MPRRKRKLSEATNGKVAEEADEKRRRNPVRKSKRRQAKLNANVDDPPEVKKLSSATKTIVAAATPNDLPSDDGSSDDWEEVEEGIIGSDECSSDHEPIIPKEGVEVTLEAPADANCGRRQRKRFDLNEYFRKQLSKFKREVQQSMHKVHLLCLIARGLHVNAVINEDIVRAVALSLVPVELLASKPNKTTTKTLKDMKRVQSWCQHSYMEEPLQDHDDDSRPFNVKSVLQDLENKTPQTPFRSVVIVALFLRIVGFDVRIVFSFRPVPLKLPSTPMYTPKSTSKQENKASDSGLETVAATTSAKAATAKRKRKRDCSEIPASKLQQKISSPIRRSGRLHKQTSVSLKEEESSCSSEDDQCDKLKVVKKAVKTDMNTDDDERDEDFKVEVIELNNPGPLKGVKKNRKTVSSDSDGDTDDAGASRATNSKDCWLEVYVDELRQWVCVHPVNENLDEPHQIETWITKPIKYVVAFDGNGHVKDLTKRYASGWLCHTRKLRVNPDWWSETLEPFRGPSSRRERDEDTQLDNDLKDRPLPTTISEYKSHPLYALKRHLLKFEGIYPPDAVPVGFVRGEPVYPRHCVKDLHSRETWLKEARLVRIGEAPYKVVKARPKWNKAIGEMQSDLPLDVFGEWQTEEYIPPPAKEGKVPRNDYGNVELFKPCMLPLGTVHLQSLNRVARKLDIDCAAAMTGWDFHGVGSHPIFDGWVVCEEFKDVLLDAWREEQIIVDQKEREKREKRIYGNWRRVIRGLLIRERLQLKYGSPATADSLEDVPAQTKKSSSKMQKKK